MPSAVPFYIQQTDPAAKREILRAAMKLFSERGFAATSIRDAARTMLTGGYQQLPVTGDADTIGLIDLTDVLSALPSQPRS